jgi:uncharacterized protein (TIGR03067 family)
VIARGGRTMRLSIPCLLVGLATAVGGGAAAQDKKPAKLDGTWVQVGYENYGKVSEIPKAERGTHTFDRGKLRIRVPALKLDKEGTYTVGDSKSPKHLDLTYRIGDRVQTMQCLYEIDGDTLRIAQPFDGPKGPRPAEMKSGVHAQIYIYKRQKE